MKYSIKVNEVRAKEGSNIKGFATVVFGDSFKITNIAILENKDKGELFVSMPRYRSNERDESNGVIYKDVCNPITAEFREELYTNILDAYARIKEPEKEETQKQERTQEMPEFSVTVTPYEREGSNIKGLARIYHQSWQVQRGRACGRVGEVPHHRRGTEGGIQAYRHRPEGRFRQSL